MQKIKPFWKDLIPVGIIIIIMTIVLSYFSLNLAIFGIFAMLAIIYFFKKQQKKVDFEIAQYLETLTSSFEKSTYFALNHLPIAMATFDEKGVLRWQNKNCEKWFPCEKELLDIEHIFPGLSLEKLQEKTNEFLYVLNNKTYNVLYNNIQISEPSKEKVILVYITDVTLYEAMKRKFDEDRLAVAYLQFDNYTNVLKGLSDNQRENVKAEVNKVVGAWIEELQGIYKQYTDDMYVVFMHRKSLEQAIEKKFTILDRMRNIKLGNKLPVTFSIGVSCDGKNIVNIGEKAQSCLDMALGRGGDQVAVALDGHILFFGGVTMAQEKSTRVEARSAAHVIKEIMLNANIIFVAGHINEDFDSIGAAIGVAKMAKLLDKQVYIVTSGQGDSLDKFKELIADNDEYKNILITDDQAMAMTEPGRLLILVDHHRPMLCAAPDLLETVKNKIVIDHHRRAEDFISDATFNYQEPVASSTSELVTELLNYFADNVDYSRLEASILYAGILVDSKNFAVQTGARTFQAAATLRLAGADPTMIRQLFKDDLELAKMRASISSSIELLDNGVGFACATLPAGGKASVAIAQQADYMLNIEGITSSFVLGKVDNDIIVSARSTGQVNVQLIMEELGGGGHQTVAGVKIKNSDLEQVKKQIIQLVKKQIEETEQNESDTSAR